MPNPSSISRRIKSCLIHLGNGEYEAALVDYFPALDKTAKRRRPKDGVGNRIRGFISDEQVIICAVSLNMIIKDCLFDGVSFPEAIYKFGRTPIAHEGELDPRLKFNDSGTLTIGQTWNLPSSYISGLCLAVIVAPENAGEFLDTTITATVLKHQFNMNDLWGARDRIRQLIVENFRNPHLFD
jgi:hypothetical protein